MKIFLTISATLACGLFIALPASAVLISQSTSMVPTASNSVSCNSNGIHTDNTYSRAFELADFGITQPFSLSSVTFAVELANGGDPATSQPLIVKVFDGWNITGDTLTPGTEVGSFPTMINDGTLFLQTVALSGTVSSGRLVVSLFTPNGTTDGHSLYIGSNNAGQTGLSFITAPDCGITNPTSTNAIGFPNMQLVMSVEGAAVPEASSLAILGLSSLAFLRRRR